MRLLERRNAVYENRILVFDMPNARTHSVARVTATFFLAFLIRPFYEWRLVCCSYAGRWTEASVPPNDVEGAEDGSFHKMCVN